MSMSRDYAYFLRQEEERRERRIREEKYYYGAWKQPYSSEGVTTASMGMSQQVPRPSLTIDPVLWNNMTWGTGVKSASDENVTPGTITSDINLSDCLITGSNFKGIPVQGSDPVKNYCYICNKVHSYAQLKLIGYKVKLYSALLPLDPCHIPNKRDGMHVCEALQMIKSALNKK